MEDAPLILNASSRSGEGLRIDTRCWRPNGQGGGSPFGNRYPIMHGQSQHGMGSAGDGGGGRMERGTPCAISNTAAGAELGCVYSLLSRACFPVRRYKQISVAAAAGMPNFLGTAPGVPSVKQTRPRRTINVMPSGRHRCTLIASGDVVAVDSEKLSGSNREDRKNSVRVLHRHDHGEITAPRPTTDNP